MDETVLRKGESDVGNESSNPEYYSSVRLLFHFTPRDISVNSNNTTVLFQRVLADHVGDDLPHAPIALAHKAEAVVLVRPPSAILERDANQVIEIHRAPEFPGIRRS